MSFDAYEQERELAAEFSRLSREGAPREDIMAAFEAWVEHKEQYHIIYPKPRTKTSNVSVDGEFVDGCYGQKDW